MWGNVKRVLRWGFVIVFVLFVIFFIFGLVTYKAMSDMGNEKRKSRAEWEERAVEYFYKELQSCYGLEKGDYRVIEEKATYADRKAEFRFEVDGKEYYGYFIGTDYLTNYFSVSDSEELKAFVEERIKASGILHVDDFEIVSARLEGGPGDFKMKDLLPTRIYGEEYEKFLRGEECSESLWGGVQLVVDVDCSLGDSEAPPKINVAAYTKDLKPVRELHIRYYRGDLSNRSPETLERERVVTITKDTSDFSDMFPDEN